MAGDGADRVVDAELVHRDDRRDHEDARDQADHAGRPLVHVRAGRRDGDETGDRAVARETDVDRAAEQVAGDDRAEHAGRRGEVRGHGDIGEARAHGPERRARIEAEPAEPQDQHAEDGQRHGVARDRVGLPLRIELADARSQQERARERRARAAEVHHGRAGEVLHAEVGEEAAAPDPVADERVDQGREHDREDDVDAELRAVEHRAPHDREADGTEDDFEQKLRGQRHRREGERVEQRVVQEETVRAENLVAAAERQPEADCPERDGSDREVDEDLRDDRSHVLAARETDLEHRESRLHEKHHAGRDDDPDRVDRDLHVGQLLQLLCRHTSPPSHRDHEKAAPKYGNGFIASEWATSPPLIRMVR